MPLFITTSERITNNFTCYKESLAPHNFPSGGGFSINNFTLRALYQNHLILQNWWTTSNDNLPLIRYTGCKITLYREAETDYLFQYNNSPPMTATLLTYTSMHPQSMLLNNHTIKMPCKKNNRNKKPYRKLKISPPTQMQNKWYFQKDLADIPLLQTFTTATSLDRMFLSSTSVTSTVGFTSLDIRGFRDHNYIKTSTTGYLPLPNTLLFGVVRGHINIQSINIGDLIFLGNPENLTQGTQIANIPSSDYNQYSQYSNNIQKQLKAAQTQQKHWGNPFDVIFYRQGGLITTNKTWEEIIAKYTSNTTLDTTWFTWKTHTHIDCRYNPFADKGQGNKIYFIDLKDKAHTTDWDYPVANTVYENLPIWLVLFGYLDYHRKCGEHSSIDTNYLLVIFTKYIQPTDIHYFVPLDQDFLEGRSPFAGDDEVYPNDAQYWHPKLRYQTRTINMLGSSGPATIKLPQQISAEAHCRYCFYFKIGGNPPPMASLTDPQDQPKYIIPNNMFKTTSLQSPTTPLQHFLWNFDERRGTLTKKASKRITTYEEPEKNILSITDTTFACPTTSQKETSSPDTSDSEKEEMSIQEQLHQQRKQQKLLRKRINLLLQQLAKLE